MNECEFPGGVQVPIEVQPYGGVGSRRLIVGPPGPAVQDISIAPVDDVDALNNVRRFNITLTDGRRFKGSPFPASCITTANLDTSSFATKVYVDNMRSGLEADLKSAAPANSVPVGAELTVFGGTVPQGWLRRDGSSFDTKKWPELAVIIPTGALPDDRASAPENSTPIIFPGAPAY
ncbi:MAG: hypothetical protein [Bacteriophage sp.]|nr:MAG: hypothetical protein [Bacteriophage sp.]